MADPLDRLGWLSNGIMSSDMLSIPNYYGLFTTVIRSNIAWIVGKSRLVLPESEASLRIT